MITQDNLERLKTILAEPEGLADLNIPQNLVIDIALRLLYTEGLVNIRRISSVMKAPLAVKELLALLLEQKLITVPSSKSGMGMMGFLYSLTELGEKRAREAMERSHYVGPLPAPISLYSEAIELQTWDARGVTAEQVKKELEDMVLPDDFHRRIGPAVNMANSLFIYGPSGNGKTTVAKKIAAMITGVEPIWMPYAVTAGGQIIMIQDRLVHNRLKLTKEHIKRFGEIDTRFGLFQRPSVVVGGELKLDALDIRYDPVAKIYEAPLQMKANGGILLIDDFGRQQARPEDMLNRWIVPLDERVDYLRLNTGQMVVVPFRELIVFSTNLAPYELAEDAFLRRIQMKVLMSPPTEEKFREIFEVNCEKIGIAFDEEAYYYLMEKYYHQTGRALQAAHPLDLLSIIRSLCEYEGKGYRMDKDLIDEAAQSYFVDRLA